MSHRPLTKKCSMPAKRYAFLLLGIALVAGVSWTDPRAATPPANARLNFRAGAYPGTEHPKTEYQIPVRIIAVGLGEPAGLRQVGMFHSGGPIPSNPEFLMQTRPGHVLDPERLLVTSDANFGAAQASPELVPGSILSIDTQLPATIVVPPRFAAPGGQAETAQGAIKLFSAQSLAFLNSAYNRHARTAALPAVAGPRYISINNAFGRPWIANSPFGAQGSGSNSVLDPNGRPLDNAPSDEAGGVFAAALTNRAQQQFTSGDLAQAALGTAFLGASPDSSGFAVFAVAKADGSVVQVHVQDGVDGLARAGTVLPGVAQAEKGVIGMAFKWNPDRALYIADAARNRIAVLQLDDDARHFRLTAVRYISQREFNVPVDLAPAIPEIANPRFASHTTLAGDSDLYILNRGDGSVLRMTQDGRILARASLTWPGGVAIGGERVRGLAVAADGQRLWISLQGEVAGYPGSPGVVVEMSAFDAAGPYHRPGPPLLAQAAPHSDLAQRGTLLFHKQFTAQEGLGPLFNARSCVSCHSDPSSGGMSAQQEHFALRVARAQPVTGRQELLDDANSPIAHRYSLHEMRIPNVAPAGIPRAANITSLRMPPALYDAAKLDQIPDDAILVNAVNKGDGIHGRPNRVLTLSGEQSIGRYGWKADIANIEEMVGSAYSNELGISNPYAAMSTEGDHNYDDGGDLVRAVVAYLRTLHLPARPKTQ